MADARDRLAARLGRALACGLIAWMMLAGAPAAQERVRGSSPNVTSDREASREVLIRVLSQPDFQRSATAILMDRLRQRVTRWFVDLWERLGGSSAGSRRAATVFAWIVGLLALAALTWWLVQSLSRSSPRHPLGLAPPAFRQRSSRAWARAALAAHQSGDDREAARCAYRSAVARLEEEGAWRQDETRTPREYLRLLAPAHRRRALLADLTARFERAWYGTDAGRPDDTRAMLARLQELGCLAPEHAM